MHQFGNRMRNEVKGIWKKNNYKYAQGRRGELKRELKLKRTQLNRTYYNIF
jgi:hypothetical protein